MPSLSTLIDNFNDNTVGPEWGNSYGGVSETGGRARVPAVATVRAGYRTGPAWTLAGATLYLKLATRPAASTGADVSASFMVASTTDGTGVGFRCDAVTGALRMQSNIAGVDAGAVEITYSGTDHLWLRLREDGTNVFWDTAPDGTTWTTRRTLATPAWVSAAVDTCAVDLYAYRDAGTTDYAEFDNLNTLSDGAVYYGAATLTAETALTAAPTVALLAAAALSADAGLTAAPVLSAKAAAALTAQSSLTAMAGDALPEGVLGLAAGDWDLTIEQGSTFVQTCTCTNGDPLFTWDGWSARAMIRTSATASGDPLLDLTPYLDVTGNRIALTIPAAVTETLTRGGRWDLELYMGAYVVRLLNGRVLISREVTR